MFLKLLRYVFFLLLTMGATSQPTRDVVRSELVNTTLPFGTMYTSRSGAIIRATFDHGPINIMNWDMIRDLATFVDSIKNDTSVKVVIFDSANPEFFIAQLSLLSQEGAPEPTVQTRTFIETAFNISTLAIVFIAEIAGRARGAGNELILQCDLRYAAKGRTLLGNFETALGLIPGAGGIQYLVNLVGRGKAMEYVLSGRDVDAETAADIGWVNSAHEPADLPLVVQNMADRLALFPREGLAAAKQRINVNMPTHQSIMDDYYAWIALVPDADAQALVAKEQILSSNESYGVYQLYEGEEVLDLYN